MRELLIATKNKGKVPEMTQPLDGLPFAFVSLVEMSQIGEVEETGSTYLENALLKARTYGKQTGLLALADDSGLEVDALGGGPGVDTANYASGSYMERMKTMLEELKNVPDGERGAKFRSVIVIYDPVTDAMHSCEGEVSGFIAHEIRGEGGFGYDPIFDYEGKGKTGGELGAVWKYELSHRGRAMKKAREILLKEFV